MVYYFFYAFMIFASICISKSTDDLTENTFDTNDGKNYTIKKSIRSQQPMIYKI